MPSGDGLWKWVLVMGIKAPGYGRRGRAGSAGPKGDAGPTGAASTVPGPKGDTGAQGIKGDTGAQGLQGIKGDTGAAGSNATATPLSNTSPRALGPANAGAGTAASRDDHVHPLPTGLLQFVGNVSVSETLLISLSAGMKRMTVTLAGITTADMGKLIVVPNGTPTNGCEAQNAYPVATNSLSVGYYTPLLGIASTYTIPVSVYRIT